jgi:3-oxoacyl-[acyl-carrier protein] reductase
MTKLNGKVAVVTGASKGIGAAIAKGLAQAGAAVVVNFASDEAGANQVVWDINDAGGRAAAFGANISDETQARALIAFAIEHFNALDILINNAGIYRLMPFELARTDDFHRMYQTNVLGPMLTMQAAEPYLRGGGAVINIATAGISTQSPGGSIYTASKAALVSMSQVVAKEWGPKGIRVNIVCPGATQTESAEALGLIDGPVVSRLIENTPLGRVGRPEDIVGPVLFLASDAARWVTGEVLFASGGSR